MISLVQPLEDVHGTVHQNAVLVINNVYFSENSSTRISAHLSAGVPTYSEPAKSGNKTVNFSVWLYTSLAAMQAQKQPLIFKGKDGNDNFNFELKQTTSDLVTVCEQWLTENVIQAMIVEEE